MVCCAPTDRADVLIKRAPLVLVEVLSPSTAAYDLGTKLARYRRIAGLQELVFIHIDARRADVYRKGADGLWVLHPVERGEALGLASVDLLLPAARLFAKVDQAEAAAAAAAAAAAHNAQA